MSNTRASFKNFQRVLNRDGSFNVTREGHKSFDTRDLYHSLLRIRWRSFLAFIALAYVVVNLAFGSFYFLLGPEAIAGLKFENEMQRFADCVFFSVQTLATIGYGRITPASFGANLIVSFEALVGLLCLALATGLFYARFSKPTARVRFSSVALMTEQNGQPCFVFRMANARLNQIVEAHLNVVLVRTEVTKEGEVIRKLYDLPLLRNHSPMFSLTWSVTHLITPESPLFMQNLESLREAQIEVLCSLTGLDDTFSQTIHSRFSYTADDLRWGGRFVDILNPRPDGRVHIQLDRLSEVTS